MLHITCNMCTRNSPDMYALSPWACGPRAYISGKSLVPMLQLLHKLLYVIQVVKRFLISNLLASTDIKVFGRTYLFAMLLLISLALFLHPGCFCLAYYYTALHMWEQCILRTFTDVHILIKLLCSTLTCIMCKLSALKSYCEAY